MVDVELDSAPQHRERLVVVAWRPEHAGTWQLHGTESDASDWE